MREYIVTGLDRTLPYGSTSGSGANSAGCNTARMLTLGAIRFSRSATIGLTIRSAWSSVGRGRMS
jgi:hypothetical protein